MIDRQDERSLIKIYKDLMVTKRDLIDLRESITSTINSIRESDQRLKIIQMKKKIIRLLEGKKEQENDRVIPQSIFQFGRSQNACGLCSKKFTDLLQLNRHRRDDHLTCPHCSCRISEKLELHEEYSCPEKTSICQFCQYLVKKKDLQGHIKICGFRECFRCRKQIFIRCYPFHIQECRRGGNKNLIIPCRKLIRRIKPDVLPECLIIEDE